MSNFLNLGTDESIVHKFVGFLKIIKPYGLV